MAEENVNNTDENAGTDAPVTEAPSTPVDPADVEIADPKNDTPVSEGTAPSEDEGGSDEVVEESLETTNFNADDIASIEALIEKRKSAGKAQQNLDCITFLEGAISKLKQEETAAALKKSK